MKAYKCYGINGYKEIIAFTPKQGNAEPDEVELYLQPYCKPSENCNGEKAIEYNGCLYFDWMWRYKYNVLYVNTYKSGDEMEHPTGTEIAIATVK